MRINQRGESLLELTMAAGLAVLVVSALTVTTIIGLRNSQLAQNQTQATKLAQAGVEAIRSIRSSNQSVCLTANSPISWNNLYSQSFTKVQVQQNGGNCAGASSKYLVASSNPDLSPTTQLPFTRRIYLELVNTKQINVTVTVDWNDYSGSHQTKLITILAP